MRFGAAGRDSPAGLPPMFHPQGDTMHSSTPPPDPSVARPRQAPAITPEIGSGVLPPLTRAEAGFNWFASKLPIVSATLMIGIAVFISIDVAGRLLFNMPWVGITDLETLFMGGVGFFGLTYAIVARESMQIDLIYEYFSPRVQRLLYLMACAISFVITAILCWRGMIAALDWGRDTGILYIPEKPFMIITFCCMGLASIAFFFQVCHGLKRLIQTREFLSIVIALGVTALIFCLPMLYKAYGVKLGGLVIGTAGFMLLMTLLLLRVPLGWAMCAIGVVGLLMVSRWPSAAYNAFAATPFTQTATFTMIAFPMFMLMGEMVGLAGLSEDLFDAATKWLGRLPGGLAIASVGGCAGFGAVCGDSMATAITMSTVAMPAMRKHGYNAALATGSLAAGGTLGILIPPSMGFIIYSMITEESVGKLFVAGILPGVVLALIFMVIIFIRVKRHPDWAPAAPNYPLKDKLISLLRLIPVIMLFIVVVMGILYGWFTPAEGGAVGAVMALLFAAGRRRLTLALFKSTMYRSTIMFGKLFALFIGLYVLQSFLVATRLPSLLADSIIEMEVSKYAVLTAVIILYIFLGCVMNIMPMMMLTLPSIFPTIQALGFDGVWFGVVCVIVMEMGMITPPVGMNVFAMASLNPDIPMGTIFRGALPFFAGMLLCVFLVVLFPQLALYLVN